MRTIVDGLRELATSSRTVLIDGAHRVDGAGLYGEACALAAHFSARLPRGSVVSFMLPNWSEAAVVYLGAALAGMVVNPILPSLRDHELSFILADADCRMIFIPREFRGHDYAAMLARVTAAMGTPPEIVAVRDGALPAAAVPSDFPAVAPDDPALLLYTSGTSGRAKGVLHSHNSIGALIGQLRDHWLIEPGDTFLVPSPIAHIGGSIYAFECPLLLGTTAVLMERWNADEAVALMVAERCTHVAGATPFLEQILDAAARAGTRLPDLKVFICGGASVPSSLIRRATAYFERAKVSRVYGSTEVPVTTVGALDDPDAAADTDGRPAIADIRLVVGEIRVRGPQMLVGYRHPQDESRDAEGYFPTGDLGRWQGDCLVVTGRAKDIIVRNGENIAPKEVEDILVGHPGIAEVAIVGLPDERTGERACAVIVPSAGSPPGIAELRSFLVAKGIARFKVPEQVETWDALPKNDAGKVLKHQIRARLTCR
ncbi:AMP-binding protein [Mycolicibacterium aubagnense]|uniref:Cyclohexanecarboxylate-CoA ligase n=1 Tax=Mycolicibacterium aubagnense TaxID=319707 RepID=A0ABN5YNG8_9MYCO|nr:AMP-binding protein [Mycolicibacterium aubagnense]TLH60203.1 cyclohexanecarboxylate-CoA ligase [Mycolicibacterium aubagnense]WGI34725.1 AMP-binding protein [Mycolicibacterium aubagnense]BBX83386.1 cyclohexanecarboxylate-CoA ligase [Mycolicibacterium aubagnense]